ncbi:MAG: LON peptidase substrate-binding domain-containing protein [Ferruginibacter sp.]|nr:LON peptidase substrate-binding domain-containing protein [Ferruginibacter sp.]
MTNFIPIFPLGIVVYPGENVNLHVFEPRYKQLINDCIAAKKPFGIPVVIDNSIQEYGTLVEVIEVSKTYSDGKMDIKTKGLQVFRTLELIKNIPDKLYCGAIANYPTNILFGNKISFKKIVSSVKQLHQTLQLNKDFKKADEDLVSYDIAHHIGLSIKQEYELLLLMNEMQRQAFLKRHLNKTLPLAIQIEYLKEKIKLNGHFKNLTSFDL